MTKEILIFLYEGFAEFEITSVSWQVGDNSDFKITTIAYDLDPIRTSSFVFMPSKKVSDITSIENVVALVIPGGNLLDLREELINLITRCFNNNILLAAICAGPQYLAASGILKDIKFTTSRTPERYIELEQEDPFSWENYIETRLVLDRNVLTAKGYAYNDFALKLWELLKIINIEEMDDWISTLNIPI